MNPGVALLVAAQFVSGLADSALLIVAMARLVEAGEPAWHAPLLKFAFTIAYVLLAPLVGLWADRWPKARVMFAANALKAAACGLMLWGVPPLLAFALAGLGAAVYSPAKYGLVTELCAPEQLVRANGWLEVSTVSAIILGTALGGVLVAHAGASVAWLTHHLHGLAFSSALTVAGWAVLLLYALAAALNMGLPDSRAHYAYAHAPQSPLQRWRHFADANRTLWRDRFGGLSLAATTLFWGAGATLQFVVLAWAQASLGLTLSRAAYLQALVAVGIAIGAMAAGRWVPLARAHRVWPLGVAMGVCVPMMLAVESLPWAVMLLLAVGAMAGFFVVPMNALVQHRGHVLLSAGQSIAVQNFNENLSVLTMLGAYSAILALGSPLMPLIVGLGLFVAGGVALAARRFQQRGPMAENA